MGTLRAFRLVAALAVLVGPVVMSSPADAGPRFPGEISLPAGFRPEGIVVGRGTTFFVGSLADGGLYRGDLRTGTGTEIFPGDGTMTVGLAIDQHDLVYAAGGAAGTGKVIDGRSGQLLQTYQFASAPTFVNDVVVTREYAWFTDSQRPVLYRVGLDGSGPVTVPLSGDYVHQAGQFNLNGIDATPNGKTLVAVQSVTGQLFAIDAETGVARRIDLGGATVRNGDGILLEGRILYVVRNRDNLVVAVRLSPDLTSGEVVAQLTHPGFDVPTTVDRFGSALYLVNARFGTAPTATTPYWVTRLEL